MIEPSRDAKEPLAEAGDEPDPVGDDEQVRLTPTLVILGLLALALGVFSAVVMSARTFAP